MKTYEIVEKEFDLAVDAIMEKDIKLTLSVQCIWGDVKCHGLPSESDLKMLNLKDRLNILGLAVELLELDHYLK